MHNFNFALDALLSHCTQQGEQVAYQVLDKKGDTIADIDYLTLWHRSHSIAKVISASCSPGDRVAIIYDTGIEFICTLLACFIAKTIAIPCAQPQRSPQKTHVSLVRLQCIIDNATPSLILTTNKLQAILQDIDPQQLPSQSLALSQVNIINTEDITTNPAALQPIQAESIAYLQYTSGTTGDPKGVIITHDNVSNNINNILNGLDEINPGLFTTAVNWLPLHHDMGLINAVLLPLYAGNLSVLISPMNFLRNPYVWLKAISSHPQVMGGGPNFSYDFCCKKISEDQKSTLNLSNWSIAYVGADVSRAEQLSNFLTTFSDCGLKPTVFHPCYGLAEATVYVTGDKTFQGLQVTSFSRDALSQFQAIASDETDAVPFINTGTPFSDHELIITNPKTHTSCTSNMIGEIWIKGPSVSPGYWNNPKATAATFESYDDNGCGPYLRTGDYGFMHLNNLYIYGRIKDNIIIRGMNFLPDDIEWVAVHTVDSILIGNVVAFSVDHNDQEQLVVIVAMKEHGDLEYDEILRDLNHAIITNFGIKPYDIVLIKAKSLATTSSGKLIRSQCKLDYLDQQYTIVASKQQHH